MIGNKLIESINKAFRSENFDNFAINFSDQITKAKTEADKFIDSLTNIDEISKSNAKSILKESQAQQLANAAMSAGTQAIKAQTVAQKALNIAKAAGNVLLNAGVGIIIGMITTKFITWMDDVIHREEKIAEAAEEAKNKISELNDEFKTQKSTVEEAIKSYDKLAEGVDTVSNKNISLSTEDYETFLNLNNQLVEIFPQLYGGLDENGNAILNFGNSALSASEQLKEMVQDLESIKNYEIMGSMPDLAAGLQQQIKDLEDAEIKLQGAEDFSNFINGSGIQDLTSLNEISIKNVSEDYRKYFDVITQGIDNFYQSLDQNRRTELISLNLNNLVTYDENGLLEYYADISKLTEEEKSKLSLELESSAQEFGYSLMDSVNNAQTEMKKAQNIFNSSYTTFLSSLTQGMQSQQSFLSLDDETQETVKNIVNNLSDEFANEIANYQNEEGDLDPYEWFYNNIIVKLNQLEPKVRQEVNNAYSKLFSFNPETTDMSVDEAQAYIDSLINVIANALGEDPIELKTQLKFDSYDESVELLKNQVADYLEDEFDDDIGKLSLGDLQIAANLKIPEGVLLSWDELIAKIEKVKESSNLLVKDFRTELNKLDPDLLDQIFIKLENGEIDESSINSIKELDWLIQETGISAGEAIEILEEMSDSYKDSFDLTSEIQNSYNILQSVKEEFKEYGLISISTLESIKEGFPELTGAIKDYTQGLISAEDLMSSLEQAYYDDANAFREAMIIKLSGSDDFFVKIRMNHQDLFKDLAEAYGSDLNNWRTLAEAKAGIETQLIQQLSKAWSKYYGAMLGSYENYIKENESGYYVDFSSGNIDPGDAQIAEIQGYLAEYNRTISRLNEAAKIEVEIPDFGGIGSDLGSESGSGSGSSEKLNEERKEIYNWMERMLEVIENKHEDINDIINDETKSYAAVDNALQNAITLDNEKIGVLKKQLEEYKSLWIAAINDISEEQLKLYSENAIDKNRFIESIVGGSFDIDKFVLPEGSTDEQSEEFKDFKNKIEEAQEAYSKVEETEEDMDDTEQDIRDHQKERFDNRIAEIEAENDALKSRQSIIESEMDLFNQTGNIVTEDMYRELIDLSKQQEDVYQKEIEAARDRMDEVEEGSAEYYQLESQIYDCEQAIIDCQTAQAEWNETIKRLPIERIQKYINMLQDIKQDLNNFLDEQTASGGDTTQDQYQQLIDISSTEIEKLLEQQEKLRGLLDGYEYGSEKYDETASEIQDIDDEISSLIQSQLEWNEAIRQIPIDKMQNYIDSLGNIKSVLESNIDAQNAQGIDTTVEQYAKLFSVTTKQIQALSTQREMYSRLLEEYDVGSSKYIEIQNQISSIDNEMNSLIQSQHEYNSAILQIPIDNLTDINEELTSYSNVLADVLSEYDSVLNAVNGVLDKQIDKINELKEATEEEYEAKIKPIQDELDLLQETNEERELQLALEQAQYNLDRARNQKTNKVVRDGKVVYEADADAIRQAEQDKQEAEYNKIVYDLEKQIENLEKERDELLEAYDEEIERLNDIKDQWSAIVEEIQLASDIAKANEMFGGDWQEKILFGDFSDLYESFKGLYEITQTQKDQVDEQIASNERISEMMQKFIEQYQSGAITYEEAMKNINELSMTMKDGYSALDQLNGLLKLDNISDLTKIYSSAQEKISESVSSLNDYMKLVKNNLDSMSSYTTSWKEISAIVDKQIESLDSIEVTLSTFEKYLDAFQSNADAISENTRTWDEMKENIAEQIKALEEAAKALEEMSKNQHRVYHSSSGSSSDDDGGNVSSPIGGGNTYVASGPGHSEEALLDAIERGDTIIYHDGIKKGAIGSKNPDAVEMLKALSLRELRPDEYPIIAKAGEVVLNREQQNTLLDNFRRNSIPSLWADLPKIISKQNTAPVITAQFGDIILPDVKNADQFAKSISRQFNSLLNQAMSNSTFRR